MVGILLSIYIILPVFIIYITSKNQVANRIGAVLIAYIFGIFLGHCGLYNQPGHNLHSLLTENKNINIDVIRSLIASGQLQNSDLEAYKVFKLQETINNLMIPIALPLLLFSLNVRTWFRMAGKTLISLVIAVFSVIVVVVASYYVLRNTIPEANKIAGMLVGLYSGGTPNLASLKLILNVDADTYIMTHTYDTVVSLFYLLFIISFGKKLFRRYLLSYPKSSLELVYRDISFSENGFSGMLKSSRLKSMSIALLLSILIFIISVALSLLFSKEYQMLIVMLSITTLSIIASVVPFVNKLEKTFELGMFFIVIFSLVVASMADVNKLLNISGSLFLFISLAIFGTTFLHAMLSRFFKVDADTFMITSTSLICSPPFVPMVADSLKNREVIVSGLTVGIIGYAIGNYLGTVLAQLL